MKRLIPVFFLLLPVALFAQSTYHSFKDRETAMLKNWGLTDSQVAQVFDIQKGTRTTIRQDFVQVRLLRAEMAKALLPVTPNMQEVNGYISQIAQTRSDMMKALVGARVQLRQIIGEDHFHAYLRFVMHHMHKHRFGHRAGFKRMHHRWSSGSTADLGGATIEGANNDTENETAQSE